MCCLRSVFLLQEILGNSFSKSSRVESDIFIMINSYNCIFLRKCVLNQ